MSKERIDRLMRIARRVNARVNQERLDEAELASLVEFQGTRTYSEVLAETLARGEEPSPGLRLLASREKAAALPESTEAPEPRSSQSTSAPNR